MNEQMQLRSSYWIKGGVLYDQVMDPNTKYKKQNYFIAFFLLDFILYNFTKRSAKHILFADY